MTPGKKDKEALPPEFSRLAQELIGDFRGLAFHEPKRMRRRPTKDMGPLMDQTLSKFHIGRNTIEDSIREQWAGIVGQANAQFCHPFLLDEKDVLHVVYSHAMVHSNLMLMKKTILAKLKELPRCSTIRDLRFKLGG